MTRRLSGELRRAQVVEAALKLLAEVPLEDLTTRLVAREVGVSQPALFRHFRSRDALLVAVVEQARASIEPLAARALEQAEPLAGLGTLVRGLFDFARRNPGLPRLFFHDLSGRADASYHRPLRLMVSMQAALVAELVRAAQARGVIGSVADPARAGFLLTSLLQGVLAQWQHGGRKGDLARDAEDLLALWTAGVAAGQPARREPGGPAERALPTPLASLDARPLLAAGEDPLEAILAAIAGLETGGVLEVLTPFRPLPLLSLLSSQGHGVADERIDASLVRVTIRRDALELPLDLRELEAPEPLERLLALCEKLPAGGQLVARLPRVPRLLLPLLSERGLRWELHESVDGTALLHLARPGEPDAN